MKPDPVWLARRAIELRDPDISAEAVMWGELRARRLNGYKFRYQHVIGRFIVDFVCLEKRVVVEIDGATHDEQADERRDAVLSAAGYVVYRATNQEVYEHLHVVLGGLLELLDARPSRIGTRRAR
jgi:very-short-patch-repair endonuclease